MIRDARSAATWVGFALALTGVLVLVSACENNSDTNPGDGLPPRENFYLTPSAAELRPGAANQAVFTVVGGEAPFQWSVEKNTLGTITPTGERSAVYARTPLLRGVNTVTVRDASVLQARATVVQD